MWFVLFTICKIGATNWQSPLPPVTQGERKLLADLSVGPNAYLWVTESGSHKPVPGTIRGEFLAGILSHLPPSVLANKRLYIEHGRITSNVHLPAQLTIPVDVTFSDCEFTAGIIFDDVHFDHSLRIDRSFVTSSFDLRRTTIAGELHLSPLNVYQHDSLVDLDGATIGGSLRGLAR